MQVQFLYSPQDFVKDVFRGSENCPSPSKFDALIREGWTDRMERGLFRYHLGDLETRILPGPNGYVAQLNIQRGIERRKPQEILSIQQEFNPSHFNFNKIKADEIICEMMKDAGRGIHVPDGQLPQPCKIVVLINVSPLEFGHCLFVPDPSFCLPQILTRAAVQAGIDSVLLSSSPGFRVGFNSLGAFASVNHLHLHGYYLDHELKIESVLLKPLIPEKNFFRIQGFPVGFLFFTEAGDVDSVARAICEVTDFLVAENFPHNLFITRGCPPSGEMQSAEERCLRRGVRIAIWPRIACFGVKEESAFNVALCELAGHLPFKNKKDFECTTEREVISIVQKYLLPDDEFQRLEKRLVKHLLTL
ncbi:PREDICTED: GDP-D-glucose phosphorylase 1 [Cyprinodon variegatus]|uniref:GDP-D-glucose phosphorylase 1 n=1 Tax=Cyprinodon variegatus TaxID=28743 RepID=A0A3Q2CH29_CYPVA|nr:PREDICTED: GDP-D-glucose phosphorylase 1 [Cyprinodon variegatus]